MRIKDLILLLTILFSFTAYTQNMAEYTSDWEGKIENSKTFNLKVEIENLDLEKASFKISNGKNIIEYPFNAKNTSLIEIPFAENYSFKGRLSKNGKEINDSSNLECFFII